MQLVGELLVPLEHFLPSIKGLRKQYQLTSWYCKYVLPPGELNYNIYLIFVKFSTFFVL